MSRAAGFSRRPRVISAGQAASLIEDGDCIYFSGSGGGHAVAEDVIEALRDRYAAEQKPRGLTVAATVSIGDWKDTGFNHFSAPPCCPHHHGGLNNCPKLAAPAFANDIEVDTLPQGVLAQLARDRAAGRPGQLTKVGLGTFVDPRQSGAKQSQTNKPPLVKLLEVDGEEYLFFRAFPIDVAVIRGTTADENGHITMEEEAFLGESLSLAMAARRSGGIVIAQVKRLAAAGSLNSRQVEIPGHLVDFIVPAPDQKQTYHCDYNPAYAGHLRLPDGGIDPLPFDVRKLIARRAAIELFPGAIVNLGFGMANGISAVAAEEEIYRDIVLTVEQGIIGGVPARGNDHGAGVNFDMLARHPDQFDFYDGGGLDLAFLSFAQVDKDGNVNVSRYDKSINGPGGFINISQGAKSVAFLGTLTTGGLKVDGDGRGSLVIASEGRTKKWVDAVDQITFNGKLAAARGQRVLYVTDRAVFTLTTDGIVLTEIAPGIDLKRDVLGQIAFDVLVSDDLKTMDARLYKTGPIGIRDEFLKRPASVKAAERRWKNVT